MPYREVLLSLYGILFVTHFPDCDSFLPFYVYRVGHYVGYDLLPS